MSEPHDKDDFMRHAEGRQGNVLAESWAMLRRSKKYWLAPLILLLILAGVVVIIGGSAAAPFIYTLF